MVSQLPMHEDPFEYAAARRFEVALHQLIRPDWTIARHRAAAAHSIYQNPLFAQLFDSSLSTKQANELLFSHGANKADPWRGAAIKILRDSGDFGVDRLVAYINAEQSPVRRKNLIEFLMHVPVTQQQFVSINQRSIPAALKPKLAAWGKMVRRDRNDSNEPFSERWSIARVARARADFALPPEQRTGLSAPFYRGQMRLHKRDECLDQMLDWLGSSDGCQRALAMLAFRDVFPEEVGRIIEQLVFFSNSDKQRLFLLEAMLRLQAPLTADQWLLLAGAGLHRYPSVAISIVEVLSRLPHRLDSPSGAQQPYGDDRGWSAQDMTPEVIARLISDLGSTGQQKEQALASLRQSDEGLSLLVRLFCTGDLGEAERLALLDALGAFGRALTREQYISVSTAAIWKLCGKIDRVAAALVAIPVDPAARGLGWTGDPPGANPHGKTPRRKGPRPPKC